MSKTSSHSTKHPRKCVRSMAVVPRPQLVVPDGETLGTIKVTLLKVKDPLGHGVLRCFFGPRLIDMSWFFPLKVTYTLLIITGGLESFQYPLFVTASMNRHFVKPIHGANAWHLARFSRGITTLHPDFWLS